MPPKRIKAEVEADGSTSATPSPSKKAKTSWSGDEEALFLDVINSICRKNLWMEAKEHDLLKGRGADGVKRHLDALEAMGWKGWQLVQEARQVIDPAGGAPQRLR